MLGSDTLRVQQPPPEVIILGDEDIFEGAGSVEELEIEDERGDAQQEETAEVNTEAQGDDKEKGPGWDWVKPPIPTLFLEIMRDGKLVKRLPLGAKSKYKFGRDKKCDIKLQNLSVSRMHAVLVNGSPPAENKLGLPCLTLLELRANNGTFYSEKYPCRGKLKRRVKKGVVLYEGMCFRLGDSMQSFVVRGLQGKRDPKNPNFGSDPLSSKLDKDFGLSYGETSKATVPRQVSSNPFKERPMASNKPVLPSVNLDVAPKLVGETTFSFHKRRKTEMESIRKEHEAKYRNQILQIKLAEKDKLAKEEEEKAKEHTEQAP